MGFVFSEKPFSERWEGFVVLSNGSVSTPPLQVSIEYARARPGPILGKVLGKTEEAESIAYISDGPNPWSSLRSETVDEDPATELYSESVRFPRRSITSEKRLVTEVAELELDELIITRRRARKGGVRSISFLLAGPEMPWLLYRSTGDTEYPSQKLDLGLDLSFEASLTRLFFRDYDVADQRISLRTSAVALVFKMEELSERLSDDAFCEQAKLLAEDLCLLVSFATRSWITWYQMEFSSPELDKTTIRQVGRTLSEREPTFDRMVVDPRRMRDFLRTALPTYRRLRDNDFDLTTALQTTLTSSEEKYAETEFISLFTGLESVKNLYAKRHGLDKILRSSTFKRLQEALKHTMPDEIEIAAAASDEANSPEQLEKVSELISSKLSELNRPPLMNVLEQMFEHYGTGWADLYPPGEKATLRDTRNSLVHSGHRPEEEVFFRDLERLRSVVERLLLRLLGWEDTSQSPHRIDRDWLIKPL